MHYSPRCTVLFFKWRWKNWQKPLFYQENAFRVTACTTVISNTVWWRCLLLDSTAVECRRSIKRLFTFDWSTEIFVTKEGQIVSQLCDEIWVTALRFIVEKTKHFNNLMKNIVVKVHYYETYSVMWGLWSQCEGVKHTHMLMWGCSIRILAGMMLQHTHVRTWVYTIHTYGRIWGYSIHTCEREVTPYTCGRKQGCSIRIWANMRPQHTHMGECEITAYHTRECEVTVSYT